MEKAVGIPPLEDHNVWADYWYYTIGVNVIPAHTRQKKTFVEWKRWQIESIPEELHAKWKAENKFANGMAIILGKTWRGDHIGEYLIFIDLDNLKAIEEFCNRNNEDIPLKQIAQNFIVEQHPDNTAKAHVFFYSEVSFPKKSSDVNIMGDPSKFNDNNGGELPAFEVKGRGNHGIAYCTPSVHKNGERYQIIGTAMPAKLSEDQAKEMMKHIDSICKKYGLQYLEYDDGNGRALTPIPDLFRDEYIIVEGMNRHEALLRIMESLIRRNSEIMPLTDIKRIAYDWNQKHCQPPLDDREFERQWKDATKFIVPQIENEKQQQQQQGRHHDDTSSPAQAPVNLELSEELTKEVGWNDIAAILSTSIKKDRAAKLITFAGMLLAQTNKDQLNIGFQAESSAGKSYIPMELANYFPQDEIMKIASASPTSFYHRHGKWDDARKATIVDLEHKNIIFMDMQGFQLMERLRPMLSHDDKELVYIITETKKQGGIRAKTVILRGFPSVVFASAKQSIDEQEKTRMILLSPAVDAEKLRESLELSALRNANPGEYRRKMLENPDRIWLIKRISSIRHCLIREIVIPDDGKAVLARFIAEHEHLKARHQRDLPRIFAFIKAHALLNCFKRERLTDDTILANERDIDAGFELYKDIETSTELGLSPYLYSIYTDVIKKMLDEDGLQAGVSRDKIIRRFYQVRHRPLSPQVLKQDILPSLEAVGLIQQAPDKTDRRKMLVFDATKAGERDDETIF